MGHNTGSSATNNSNLLHMYKCINYHAEEEE